ncbi:MAG: ATP-binding cassette domain-containing protein [Rickettsia endosymbiont of Glossina mortisans submortisans]|nr:ATP-binding cassette domain-containing protein [Rickettsia endosymbiont of Glossina mortisans submortisans]
MLSLKNIEVTFGKNTKLEQKILNKLSLSTKEGEIIVIIGNNGAGKSTLFNVISGFIKPDYGKIFISKQDVTETSQIYRAGLVSTVIQDSKVGTIGNMTILENMAFAFKQGQKRGFNLFSNKLRIELFQEKLRMLDMGLENRMNELVSNLSGGQRQALSLIMSALYDAKILLFDEITAALDPGSSESIIKFTTNIIHQKKCTCIMNTHNIAHAIKYGDRLLLLKGVL